ncbi:amidohydrolase family protein [Rhodobacteraceae bacterium M382]|nr:amidohydrolase family protein [Rhodobacteraceae bacterium M382]
MTEVPPSEIILSDVKVPLPLVACPDAFGGRREQGCLRGDLVIRDRRAVRMQACAASDTTPRMVLPRLTECHVHLDKCHTIARMQGVGGDLQAAIAAQAADRRNWTAQDIRTRAARGLDELIAAGCGSIRSHVDWGTDSSGLAAPVAWPVLCELVEDYRDRATVQLAPLFGVDDLQDPRAVHAVAQQIAPASGVLGVFVLDQQERRSGIRNALAAAETHGLALDFHVDEGLGPGLDGLEIISDVVLETGFQGPVLCGHACSLMNLSGDALNRLTDKVARAGITVVCLPATNLYLQGRDAGTPDRRGLTRLRELRDAGVRVLAGTDNVRDAFCPLGRHDPMHALSLTVLAAHLDPPFEDYLPMITTSAETALGLVPTTVDGAAIGDLILIDAATMPDLLAGGIAPVSMAEALQGDRS